MSTFAELFPSKTSSWTGDDMPDLTGRIFLVTGGNSGIGKETVKVSGKEDISVHMLTWALVSEASPKEWESVHGLSQPRQSQRRHS